MSEPTTPRQSLTADDLYVALCESLKLQAHYAYLLNMYDGGLRTLFLTPEEWLARLRETKTIPVGAMETHQ